MDAVDGNVRPGQRPLPFTHLLTHSDLAIQLLRHFDDGIDVLWPTVHDQLYVAFGGESSVGGMMKRQKKQKCRKV